MSGLNVRPSRMWMKGCLCMYATSRRWKPTAINVKLFMDAKGFWGIWAHIAMYAMTRKTHGIEMLGLRACRSIRGGHVRLSI